MFAHLNLLFELVKYSHIHTQTLQFLNEYFEGLRHAGLRDVLALDNCLIGLNSPDHVVRLNRKQFLEGVGSAICL